MKNRLPPSVSLVVAAFLGAGAAQAQQSAATDEKVVLNPFEVKSEKDFGYRAAASTTGTGIAGLIKDTPMNISVLTGEFIQDTKGTQLVDVLRAAGSVTAQTKDEGDVKTRGFSSPVFINGVGGVSGGIALYDVDRIEVMKGPNSVFAGLSNAGGTVNVIKMKPSFKTQGSLQVSGGDYDNRRVTLRHTGPLLSDKLAYMLVYGHTSKGSAIDDQFIKEDYYAAGLSFRPLKNLTLTARYSDNDREAGRPPYITVSHPLFQQMDKEAIANFDSRGLPRPANYPRLENGAVRDAAGNPIQTGFGSPETVDSFIARSIGPNSPPYTIIAFEDYMGRWDANYNGPEGRDSYRAQVFTADAEWVVNRDLAFRAVYQEAYSHRYRREFNGFRPVAGQRLRSAAGDLVQGDSTNFQAKVEGTYKLDLREFGKHDVLLGFQHDGGTQTVGSTSVNSATINYNPRTDPIPRLLQMIQQSQGPSYGEKTLVDRVGERGGAHRNALFGVLQSGFFNDRVRTLVGARQVTSYQPIATATPGVETDFRVKKTVPQTSLLVRLTPEISVYASRSTTFVPQRQVTADVDAIRASQGDPTSPTYRPPTVIPQKVLTNVLEGEGREAGLKFELFGGRLLGTATYFESEQSGQIQTNAVAQTLYQLPGGATHVASGKQRTRGVESDFTWSPTRNYQVIFNAAYFFEAEEITNAADPRQVGKGLEGIPDYNLNFWNKYTFVEGALKGAYIGGGVNIEGPYTLHPSWTVTVRSKDAAIFGALVGYATRFNGVPLDIQLNVQNLADERYLNGSFLYGEPRSFLLSLSTKW
jgi:outer membrane receptor protein involved in Fe transport